VSRFERSIDIACSVQRVFDFHLDTRNAAAIAPPGQRIVRVEGRFPVREGDEVLLVVRQRPLPFAQRWRVRIVRVEEPVLVVDELLQGPFARFRHEHRLDDLGGGRTRLTDRIEYELPFGALGRLADRLVVSRLMGRTFAARQEATRRLLETTGAGAQGPGGSSQSVAARSASMAEADQASGRARPTSQSTT
jgi:ligand-binding SRPBCC domain-containing protein